MEFQQSSPRRCFLCYTLRLVQSSRLNKFCTNGCHLNNFQQDTPAADYLGLFRIVQALVKTPDYQRIAVGAVNCKIFVQFNFKTSLRLQLQTISGADVHHIRAGILDN